MSIELQKARAAQLRAWDSLTRNSSSFAVASLTADYTLLDATQEAIYAQTEKCDICKDGVVSYSVPISGSMSHIKIHCEQCKGRGRVPRKEVVK